MRVNRSGVTREYLDFLPETDETEATFKDGVSATMIGVGSSEGLVSTRAGEAADDWKSTDGSSDSNRGD